MLTQLSISGFRCFKQIDVELKPLTVLIGPNDTGKSSFLEAVEHLGADKKRSRNSSEFFRNMADRYAINAKGTHGEIFNFTEFRQGVIGPPMNFTLHHGVRRFQLPASGVEMECRGFEEDQLEWLLLESDGSRVAALIDHLLRNDLDRYLELREQLRRMVPGFEDLKVETPTAVTRRIDFVVENGLRIQASCTSAGVRLLLFFLALVHHPKPPGIILLEEPETGIHPKRLAEVMRLLRGITQGEFGNVAAQVILTTHSPYLLDLVLPEVDQVLVFQREADGSRTAKPVDWNRLKEFFDGFMLGEIWFNEEEAGLVSQGAS